MKFPSNSKRTYLNIILIGIVMLLIVIILVFLPVFRQRLTSPLGPTLGLPTFTPTTITPSKNTNTATISDLSKSDSEESQVVDVNPLNPELSKSPNSIPTSTKEPLCGGPPLMYILGIGVDTKDPSYSYGLADVIRIARIDFVTPKVTVLSFPRDLWVEIPEISDHYGITHGKLNQAFLYGGPGMSYYDGPGGAPGLMARTIDHNFGIRVDHYGALNMLTFLKIIDAVGGIDLYLPTDVDGTSNVITEDMGYFYAGNNHFTGDEALRFSRIRKRSSDFQRQSNQNLVLCAMKEKLLNPSVLPKIPQIVSAFHGSVLTDLSLEQIGQLACLLPSIEEENLLLTSFPKDIFEFGYIYSDQMRNETYAAQADFEALKDYIDQFNAGTWPSESQESLCP